MDSSVKNIIISLFDYSGSWSQPYRDAGYLVFQVDLLSGTDILTWDYSKISKSQVFGILAAPPCTHFTKASSLYWDHYDLSGKTDHSILLVRKSLEIITHFNPNFWALETPPGRLWKLIPELLPYKILRIQPSYFGDPLFKQTEIYGHFNPFLFHNHVKPFFKITEGKSAPSIMDYYKKNYPRLSRSLLRSITPPGFAYAFYQANRNHLFESTLNHLQSE